jgi:hypothetical protein
MVPGHFGGAVRGAISQSGGLEPTTDCGQLVIQHQVSCFRATKRVIATGQRTWCWVVRVHKRSKNCACFRRTPSIQNITNYSSIRLPLGCCSCWSHNASCLSKLNPHVLSTIQGRLYFHFQSCLESAFSSLDFGLELPIAITISGEGELLIILLLSDSAWPGVRKPLAEVFSSSPCIVSSGLRGFLLSCTTVNTSQPRETNSIPSICSPSTSRVATW